jgi:hypothetical protein
MKRAEDSVPSSQVRRRRDFIVHAARSCSVRVRVLRPRRLLARSFLEVSFSWLSAERILEELTKSIWGSGLPSYAGGFEAVNS